MGRQEILAVALALVVLAPSQAFAGITVHFIDPGRFTDAGTNGFRAADPGVLAGIKSHLQRLGSRFLAPGQNLTIDILDIDLAGEYEP